MKLALSLLLVCGVSWGPAVGAHPLQPEAKTGFAAFQGMRPKPSTEEALIVSFTAPPAVSLGESMPIFRRQAADLIKLAEDLGLEISPKGAAMKVFSSGW